MYVEDWDKHGQVLHVHDSLRRRGRNNLAFGLLERLLGCSAQFRCQGYFKKDAGSRIEAKLSAMPHAMPFMPPRILAIVVRRGNHAVEQGPDCLVHGLQ